MHKGLRKKKIAIWGRPFLKLTTDLTHANEVVCYIDDDNPDRTFRGVPVIAFETFRKQYQSQVDALVLGRMWHVANGKDFFSKLSSLDVVVLATRDYLAHAVRQYEDHWSSYFRIFADHIANDIQSIASLKERHNISWKDVRHHIEEQFDFVEERTLEILSLLFQFHDAGNATSIETVRAYQQLQRAIFEKKRSFASADEYCYGQVQPSIGNVIINAGGDTGHELPEFLHKIGTAGRIYVFEPSRSAAQELTESYADNPRVTVVKEALANCQGMLPFVEQMNKPGISRLGDMTSCEEESKSYLVPATTIDLASAELNLDHVDYLKMDIEGAEYDALQGAQQTIRKYKPKLAICVYHLRRFDDKLTFEDEDIVRIPKLLRTLVPEYRLGLVNTEHTPWGGTKLFATV